MSYQYDHGRISSVLQGARLFTMVPYPSTGSSTPGWPKTVTVTDRSGSINTIIVPDNAGRPLSSTTSYTTGSTAPRETDSTWDGEGNLLTLSPPSALPASSRPVHTQTYTQVNLLQSYSPPAVASIPNSTTTFLYNADRGLEYVRQPGGRGVDYVYTESTGQLTGILADGGTNASFTYYPSSNTSGAANGRLQTATRGATTVSLAYDGPLNTSQVTAGGVNGSAAWTYDADFRVSSETVSPAPTPTGLGTASYQYDADGLLTCASLTGSLSTCTPSATTMVLTPDPTTGALTSTSLGVVTEAYTPNEYGELASYKATAGGATISFVYDDGSQALSRDGFGRVYHQTESGTGYPTLTTDYRYDEQGRLSKVLLGGVLARQYGYDYNGNRTSVDSSGAIIATYDNQDRMLTYLNMSYGYGPNGERSTRTSSTDGSVDQYQYDAVGNLVHITRADSVTIDYVVDAFNRRIAKNKNGVAYTQYIYRNGLSPVAVLTASGTLAARFVYASRPNTPDFMVLANGAVYKFINDQRGSPHAIVNAATGAVAKLMTYDEFGNQTVMLDAGVIPTWVQPFGFAGGLYDEDTGLTRFGARDYEAATGRWLAKDPILFAGGQANLYVYAGNDPVNRVDSTGKIGNYLGWNVFVDSPWFPALGALFGLSVPSGGGVSGGIFYDFNFSTFDFSAGFYKAKTSLVAASKSPLVCGAGTEAGVLKSVAAFGGSSAGPAAAIGDWGGSASFDPASPLSVSSLQSVGVSVGLGTGGYIGGFLQDTSLTGFSAGASGIKTF